MADGNEGMSETLSVAERRELRRKRILEGSKSRLEQILNGPSGTEKRNAPVLEGGNFYSSMDSTTGSSNFENRFTGSMTQAESDALNDSFDRQYIKERVACLNSCRANLQNYSFEISLFAGIVLRFLVAFSLLKNVVIPWTLFAVSVECFTLSGSRKTVPQCLYISILSQFGFSQAFIDSTGYFYRIVSSIMSHSVLAAFGFLTTHLFFYFITSTLSFVGL